VKTHNHDGLGYWKLQLVLPPCECKWLHT